MLCTRVSAARSIHAHLLGNVPCDGLLRHRQKKKQQFGQLWRDSCKAQFHVRDTRACRPRENVLALSVLRLDLPATWDACVRAHGQDASSSSLRPGNLVRGRVHLISSSPEFLSQAAAILGRTGGSVLAHERGEEFLAGYEPCPPECVVTELLLSGISGLEVQRRVAKKSPTPPIIFLTQEASVVSAVEAMKQGAFDFILWPAEPLQVLDTVHR